VAKDKIKILSTPSRYFEGVKRLLPSNFEVILSRSRLEEDILPLIDDVDILVGVRATRRVIEKAKKLKMIQALGTGVDRIDVEAAEERGIVVCNAVGLNAVPCAEHAMSLVLSLAKDLTIHDKRIRKGEWRDQRRPSVLLYGKTLGIIGLGSIGIEVSKRARAFGMKVIGLKRKPSEELKSSLGLDFLGSREDLPRIMRESDFIVLSIVLTPETGKMIGEEELRMMKKSAYIVNISRGGVIDEEALIKVLEEGAIAGAGLDVFEVEPINPDNPLLQLGNVVLTPHMAGGGGMEELTEERAKFIVGNIMKLIRGEKPDNIVDPILKYVIKEYHSFL
jgi:phosphoglycerate dehydrogenase-like enzyme